MGQPVVLVRSKASALTVLHSAQQQPAVMVRQAGPCGWRCLACIHAVLVPHVAFIFKKFNSGPRLAAASWLSLLLLLVSGALLLTGL